MTELTSNTIWYSSYSLKQLNGQRAHNMTDHLGIQYTELGPDYLKATMPVDQRTQQPFGLLHGGASCVLAESLGSVCAWMCIDIQQFAAVGLDINANHLRSVKQGVVTGECRAIHIGRRTHVWGIEIRDDNHKLVCVSRLTVAIIQT